MSGTAKSALSRSINRMEPLALLTVKDTNNHLALKGHGHG